VAHQAKCGGRGAGAREFVALHATELCAHRAVCGAEKSLTGESSERVDTRVLQILYRFERGSLPVYVGQQLDVFIEAPPITDRSDNGASRPSGTPVGGQ